LRSRATSTVIQVLLEVILVGIVAPSVVDGDGLKGDQIGIEECVDGCIVDLFDLQIVHSFHHDVRVEDLEEIIPSFNWRYSIVVGVGSNLNLPGLWAWVQFACNQTFVSNQAPQISSPNKAIRVFMIVIVPTATSSPQFVPIRHTPVSSGGSI